MIIRFHSFSVPALRRTVTCAALLIQGFTLHAQDTTALGALKALPSGKSASVTRIIGPEGKPSPDRWYLLTYDSASENGVKEFVVSKGELVASRNLSQFADAVKADEILGKENLKIDSDAAAKIARDYAHANEAVIARIDYELKKEGAEAAPIWKLTCFNESGSKIGEVVVTAGKGTVVSHEGFLLDPAAQEAKFDTAGAETDLSGTNSSADTTEPSSKSTRKKSADSEDGDGHHLSKPFRKVGGSLQKFFTGKDTISR